MKSNRHAQFRELFRRSVSINAAGCWIWQKHTHKNGYGRVRALHGRKVDGAHRVAYQVFVGPIPAGLDVCHKCDVRNCVNPDHLFTGTRAENIQDAVRKNRINRTVRTRGSDHPSSKLTETDIHAISARLIAGETKASIARSFGVSDRTILLISRGESWKHAARAA